MLKYMKDSYFLH